MVEKYLTRSKTHLWFYLFTFFKFLY